MSDTSLGTWEPARGERIGPYEVEGPIARGGMASVLAVRDVRDGARRAMKLLLPLSDGKDAHTRFRREFRALSRLKHPGILEVFESGVHGDRPWFTMERLDGEPLKSAVAGWANLAPEERFARAERVLREVARALAYAHERGLVHRDVTPGNIMVLPDGSARLMDFGVVKDAGTDLTAQGEMVGTVAYIAPEQITGVKVDARADLYSLGAVLYLMLTGRRPFSARNLHGYIEKHLHEAPRPPREVEPLCPPHLDRICLRLLEKDPADRFASAHHLLHVLGDSAPIESDDHWPSRVVGRTLISARIRDSIEDLAAGAPGRAVVLVGRPGLGKTRLLDLGVAHAKRLGLTVARGRCRAQDRPFGAFVSVARALAGDDLNPVLKAALDPADDRATTERYAVHRAFFELLLARAPCVVVLDDLGDADPATAELLDYLVRNTLGLAAHPVTFLLGQEPAPEGRVAERRLRDLPRVEEIAVEPLGPSEVEELVVSILGAGAGSEALARRLYAESDGSPAFVADMIRGLIEEGVLVRTGARWQITLDPAELTRSQLPIPTSLREAVQDRLELLSADALEVVRALATSRRRLDIEVLIDVLPMGEDRVIEALDQIEEHGLVEERVEADVECFELAQGRVRDVVLAELTSEDRRQRHLALGEGLERRQRQVDTVPLEELAFQFEQAGVPSKAYTFLVLAARRHLNRSLYEESLGFIERALSLEHEARPLMLLDAADATLAEVHLARSQARFHLGDRAGALESVERALHLARQIKEPRLLSRILAEQGEQLRNRGRPFDAERALEEALVQAERAGDLTLRPMPTYGLGAIVWARGDLTAAESRWREAVALAERCHDDRALGFGFNGLGILAVCQGDTVAARTNLEKSAKLFQELGIVESLGIARVNLVELYLSTGVLKKALSLAERTIAEAKEMDHAQGIAFGLTYRAEVLLELGRTEEAGRNAVEALRRLRALGESDDEIKALATLARVDLAEGRPLDALTRLLELDPLLGTADPEGLAPMVDAWRASALVRTGRVDEAIQLLVGDVERERRWPLVRVRTDLARAQAWREVGREEVARDLLLRALGVADAHQYRLYQLAAQHELVLVSKDPNEQARHRRSADALARSVAASLPREEAEQFLGRWPALVGPMTTIRPTTEV